MSTRKTRSLVIFFVGLAAADSGAAIAAMRASGSPIGAGVVVINTNLRLEEYNGLHLVLLAAADGATRSVVHTDRPDPYGSDMVGVPPRVRAVSGVA